jgi:MFS family permease
LSAPVAPRRQALAIFAALAAAYSASQFYRASPTVIAPELMRDLSLSSETVGVVAGMFFLAFGLAQIPVGMFLDRFGARLSMSVLLCIAVAGALMFASAGSAAVLGAGRALLGLGCAAGLMGAMVVLARWFPPEKFATMSGLLMGFASAGVLLAATPLALATAAIGWRGAFVVAAGVTAALAVLLYGVVRDAPPGYPGPRRTEETPRQVFAGVATVMRDRRLWRICATQLTIYPSVMTVAALWAGPYLEDVHGLDTQARGEIMNFLFGALVVSPILLGPLDRVFNTRKRIVVASALSLSAVLAALALWPSPALWQVSVLFVLLGLASAGSLVLHAHARSILPDHLVGRGMTFQNTAGMGGIFVMQSATGLIIGAFENGGLPVPEIAYRLAFGFLAAMLLLSLLVYRKVGDVRPGERAADA